MFGFSQSDHRSAVVVDVGSSSVGVAIVCVGHKETVEQLWRHREYCLISNDTSAVTQIRQIKTALTNAFLELTNNGLKTLNQSEHNHQIDEVQVIVSAPWSYTITRTITLRDEHPFEVTAELIEELVDSAEKQSKLVFATDKISASLGLEITHGDVLGITLNGYNVIDPLEQEGRDIAVSYAQTAISGDITEMINDATSKFFPKAKLTRYSFMYAFYLTMHHLRPSTSEVCLVNVTGEATEVGIIREGMLKHTTFTPTGMYTLARELATNLNVPKEEAFAYMKEAPDTLLERLSEKDGLKVAETISHYTEQMSKLFLRTGDSLTIPKTIFLHTDMRTGAFFKTAIEKAAEGATSRKHMVHPVTDKVLGTINVEDTAMHLSTNFLVQKGDYMKLLPKDI